VSFVRPRSDAASAKMHLFVCEHKVSRAALQNALSRSALLRDMHRDDPEGCVIMPCDTGTWTAWLADDPSQMTADTMELMLAVIKVRFLSLKKFGCLRAACSNTLDLETDPLGATGGIPRYAAKLLHQANLNARTEFSFKSRRRQLVI
jgi:hypothetical protein